MKYKGYTGVAQVDPDAGVIRGKIVDLKDTITFQGKTVDEAVRAFHDSVDDYLEFCKELGEPPEKPFSGTLLIRIEPKVHRGLSALAQSRGVSVNAFVADKLKRYLAQARGARGAGHTTDATDGPGGPRSRRAKGGAAGTASEAREDKTKGAAVAVPVAAPPDPAVPPKKKIKPGPGGRRS